MNVLIVEDELIIAYDLCRMVRTFGYEAIEPATTYNEAVAALEEGDIDMAILDINLGEDLTGIDIARYIRQHVGIPFIFISSYEDAVTVRSALETSPHAYLQKPFQKASVFAAIELAMSSFHPPVEKVEEGTPNVVIKNAIFIKDRQKYHKVPVKDIAYIKSDGNYLELFTAERKYLMREALKNIQEQLPQTFLKVNKSYIVNLQAITSINAESVFISDTEVPYAPNYKDELMSRIKTFS